MTSDSDSDSERPRRGGPARTFISRKGAGDPAPGAAREGAGKTAPKGAKAAGDKRPGGKGGAAKARGGANAPEAPSGPRTERLARRLARAGVASRRMAEEIILAGRVRVNGKPVDTPAFNVEPGDKVELDGAALPDAEPPRMWRYHKPSGLVTSEADEKGRATVFDRLPADLPRVMTVGRLDLNSEGLLLLTNDGDLKRRLELPSTGWLRKYRVRVHGTPDDKALEPLRRGVEVDGERFQPMTVTLDRQQGANAWLTVGLREGRNREVRRALSAVGFDVSRLIRVSYGPFLLGDLPAGEVEEIRPKVLRDQLGLPAAEVERPEPRAARPAPDEGAPRAKGPRPAPRRAEEPAGRKPGAGKPGQGKPGQGKPRADKPSSGKPGAAPARAPRGEAASGRGSRGESPFGRPPRGDGPTPRDPRGDGPSGRGPRSEGSSGRGPRGDGPSGRGPRGEGPSRGGPSGRPSKPRRG
ncbi:pseudouridine synthase [Albimonas sp. CAU 1670]|uniref:pseudouridine synthase n=1 Tax=Albimonas sp. CAU 1670 TaxID=3032599 RepID=UPI0023DCB35A|nr:pseudouridine synthase [Albimonas sp. CAU 1670]MDF2234011.1 pseudouridine synthase [Albimonas sp. CAU 1670]